MITEIEDALNQALRDLRFDGATGAVTLHLRQPAFESLDRAFPPERWHTPNRTWDGAAVMLTDGPQVVVCTLRGRQHVREVATVRFCTPCGNYWYAESGPLTEECHRCTSTQLGWTTREWAMFAEVEAKAAAVLDIAKGALKCLT